MQTISITKRSANHFANTIVACCFVLIQTLAVANAWGEDFGEAYTQPIRLIQVATGESGRVAKVNVKEGDQVAKGDVLLTLDTTVLEATRRMAVADAEATASIKMLVAQYKLAARRLDKIIEITASGSGHPEERWRAEVDRDVARFRVDEAYEERKKKELRVHQIDAQMRARSLICPIDGTVVDVHFDEGELLPANEPRVVTVVDLSHLRATFYVPTAAALSLSQGDDVWLVLENGDSARGQIEYVGVVTEYESGRVRIKVLIDNRDKKIRSGMRCSLDPRKNPFPSEPFAQNNR